MLFTNRHRPIRGGVIASRTPILGKVARVHTGLQNPAIAC